jgi:hypothetical protein
MRETRHPGRIGTRRLSYPDYSVVTRKTKPAKEMWLSGLFSPRGSVRALLVPAVAEDYDIAGSPNDRQAVPAREYVSMSN